LRTSQHKGVVMASKRLEVIITGKATGALKAIHDTEGAAGGLKGKVASAGKAMVGSPLPAPLLPSRSG
jgi:hypothetical protein